MILNIFSIVDEGRHLSVQVLFLSSARVGRCGWVWMTKELCSRKRVLLFRRTVGSDQMFEFICNTNTENAALAVSNNV